MRAVSLAKNFNDMKTQVIWWLRGRTAIDALLAAAFLLVVIVTISTHLLRQNHMQIEREIDVLRARTQPMPVESDTTKRQRDIETFIRSLPQRNELSTVVSKIFEIAGENNVDLQRADYRLVDDSTAKLIRYQIKYPVKGEPLAIHTFVLEALNALPALALDSISFKRERTDAKEVDAQIGFLLYVAPTKLLPSGESSKPPHKTSAATATTPQGVRP